jgi:hypothetical protein
MGANPDTKLQVNYGGGNRPLINVYATDVADLADQLNSLADVAGLIGETGELLGAVSVVQQQLGGQVQPQGQAQAQQSTGGPPQPAEAEFCQHGAMLWKSGIAKQTGNPYGLWECAAGKPPAGCGVRWPKKAR